MTREVVHLSRCSFTPTFSTFEDPRLDPERQARQQQLVAALHDAATAVSPSARAVRALSAERRRLGDLLRFHRTMAAAAIIGTDWQSPSFGHSVRPAAGRFAGRVTEHRDDYRRDRHPDAAAFEAAYLREMVDAPAGTTLRALMTGLGTG